jgi:16S rRNA (cytosine1402-N4)-methyltransferase
MRLDPTQELTAADLVNTLDERQLTKIFRDYGEERWAARIAKNIVRERRQHPIETTTELVRVIEQSIPAAVRRTSRIHPATRVFQALRIAVNDELDNLQRALTVGFERLAPDGRFVVISFHSPRRPHSEEILSGATQSRPSRADPGTDPPIARRVRAEPAGAQRQAPGAQQGPLTDSLQASKIKA